MITAGTSPFIYIDLGNDEPSMILQRLEGREWRDFKVDGKPVSHPLKLIHCHLVGIGWFDVNRLTTTGKQPCAVTNIMRPENGE